MLVRPSVDPVNMLRLHPVSQVLEPTRVCCGLIARMLFMLSSGVGVKGGGRILKGGGRGEGLEEGGFIGVLLYLCCVVSLLFCCVCSL